MCSRPVPNSNPNPDTPAQSNPTPKHPSLLGVCRPSQYGGSPCSSHDGIVSSFCNVIASEVTHSISCRRIVVCILDRVSINIQVQCPPNYDTSACKARTMCQGEVDPRWGACLRSGCSRPVANPHKSEPNARVPCGRCGASAAAKTGAPGRVHGRFFFFVGPSVGGCWRPTGAAYASARAPMATCSERALKSGAGFGSAIAGHRPSSSVHLYLAVAFRKAAGNTPLLVSANGGPGTTKTHRAKLSINK